MSGNWQKVDPPKILLGTTNKDGKLHVEYRSKAGKLGVYLLLRDSEFVDRESGEIRKRCLLGFVDGRKLPDGKDGFWVDRSVVNFGKEQEETAPAPKADDWPRAIQDPEPDAAIGQDDGLPF